MSLLNRQVDAANGLPVVVPRGLWRSGRRVFLIAVGLLFVVQLLPVLNPTTGLHIVSSAYADDGDEDGGGDDGDDNGGDDGDGDTGGGSDPGAAPAPTDEILQDLDDGDNAGPRDEDCFNEAVLRPTWLRPCDDRPSARPRRRPQKVIAPAPPPVRRGSQAAAAVEPANALPRELVALRLTEAQLSQLQGLGFVVLQRTTSPLGGGDLFRLSVPAGLSTAEGLSRARSVSPAAIFDFNHIYRPAKAKCDQVFCEQRRSIKWPQPPNECSIETVIGLIDTSVDASVPALAGQNLMTLNGVSGNRKAASKDHGTAIAALLVGRSDADVPGLLPKSGLVSVQAFHVSQSGEDIADTFDIVSAVDALVARGLKVINLSFTGPNNRVLADVVSRAVQGDALLIAAAGNQGPAAPVVYPAGYEGVVAVTAVGEDLRIYRGANRGRHIDFAAPGVNVQVVSAKVATRFETGTSFAAPFVTAALAVTKSRMTEASSKALVSVLQGAATDLGKPGRDPVFGWGLVQVPEICQ